MEPLYRELDHAADLRIELRAASRSELFRKAALSLYSLLVDCRHSEAAEQREIRMDARDDEELLQEWLSRLLSDFFAEGFVATTLEVRMDSGPSLSASLRGMRFDRERCALVRELKAVTWD